MCQSVLQRFGWLSLACIAFFFAVIATVPGRSFAAPATQPAGNESEADAQALVKQLREADTEKYHRLTFGPSGTVIGVVLTSAYSSDHNIKLLRHLPDLEHIKIRCPLPSLSFDALPSLTGLTKLRELDVELISRDFTAQDAAAIAQMKNLTALEITDCGIAKMSLTPLAKLPHLRRLKINGPEFGDDQIGMLTDLQQIEQLNLDGTSITDRGLRTLKALKHLKSLSVEGTEVTAAGVRESGIAEKVSVVGPKDE